MNIAKRGRPDVRGFFEKRTFSVQYVISDPATRKCAIIDPVLDFEEKSASTATEQADAILRYIETERLKPAWILETHLHADHLSAAGYLKDRTGARTAIGESVVGIQKFWKDIYNWPDFPADGSQWDHLLADGEGFFLGEIEVEARLAPGHTPASITFVAGDAVFVHDTLFMPDYGTARADFPGGDARALWRSIQAILALPDEFRVFTGHDYLPGGRAPLWESTIAEQQRGNIHVAAKTEAEFVGLREARDKTLAMPKLILPSLQVNIRGGRLPEPDANGRRYLKIPLDAFRGAVWD
jgi:glyoxylase-like metal-dependent hydrolase (beta-lactamase superfamily II)